MRLITACGRTALDAAVYGLAILGALAGLYGGATPRFLLVFWLLGLATATIGPLIHAIRSGRRRAS